MSGDLDPASAPSGDTQLRFVAGNPTDAEIAAVTAVLAAVVDELAEQDGAQPVAVRSAWDRSRRNIRSSIHPGPGLWRSFSA